MTDAPAQDDESPSERTETDGDDAPQDDQPTGNPPATPETDESVSDDIAEAFQPGP